MSLSTFVAESRRSLDATLSLTPDSSPGAGATATSAAPTTVMAAATAPAETPIGSSAAAEDAADRFFPSDRGDHGISWQGRAGVDAESLQWRASGEFGSRDLGWGGATLGGIALAAGPGGVAADASAVRLEGRLGENASGRVDGLQAGATFGVAQGDGSRGIGLGVGANLVAGEATYDRGGFRGTFGLSAGVGAGAGIGLRDSDGDGRTEICSSVSAGPVTTGVCYEPYTLVDGARRLGERGVDLVAGLMRP